MGNNTRTTLAIGCATAVFLIVIVSVEIVEAARHPRLVSLDSTRCTTCHDDLTRGMEVIHAPVGDDCTNCHDVSIGDDGTTVELSAGEPDLCVMCHDTLEAAVAGDLEAPHAAVMDSCLNCHRPHASSESALLTVAKSKLCIECHDPSDLGEIHGGQITETIDCTSCHRPHGSDNASMLSGTNQHAPFADGSCEACHRQPFAGRIRLNARREKVCTSCHGDLDLESIDATSVHEALRGARRQIGCINCHNPHMSANPTLLVEKAASLCAQCHSELVATASAETGHAPAAEDCSNCHLPHTSENQSLLVEKTPDLCTMCHDPDDDDLAQTHLGATLGSLDCTGCHTPHGNGNESLLADNIHAVILDGCDTCHEGGADQLVSDGESELCLACHSELGELAESAAVPHPAMEMLRCADCHNPHASKNQHLLLFGGGAECTTCHDNKAPEADEVGHSAIALIGCRACHEPHGSANASLLRQSGSELCLSCHDAARIDIDEDQDTAVLAGRFAVSTEAARRAAVIQLTPDGEHGHPLAGHRVLGQAENDPNSRTQSTFEGVFECSTCHNPHKGKSRLLLNWNARAAYQACEQCHEK